METGVKVPWRKHVVWSNRGIGVGRKEWTEVVISVICMTRIADAMYVIRWVDMMVMAMRRPMTWATCVTCMICVISIAFRSRMVRGMA